MLQNLRLIISLHLKKERKDDMPKKHDPQWGREKKWRTKEVRPKKMKEKMAYQRSTTQKNGESVKKKSCHPPCVPV